MRKREHTVSRSVAVKKNISGKGSLRSSRRSEICLLRFMVNRLRIKLAGRSSGRGCFKTRYKHLLHEKISRF